MITRDDPWRDTTADNARRETFWWSNMRVDYESKRQSGVTLKLDSDHMIKFSPRPILSFIMKVSCYSLPVPPGGNEILSTKAVRRQNVSRESSHGSESKPCS